MLMAALSLRPKGLHWQKVTQSGGLEPPGEAFFGRQQDVAVTSDTAGENMMR